MILLDAAVQQKNTAASSWKYALWVALLYLIHLARNFMELIQSWINNCEARREKLCWPLALLLKARNSAWNFQLGQAREKLFSQHLVHLFSTFPQRADKILVSGHAFMPEIFNLKRSRTLELISAHRTDVDGHLTFAPGKTMPFVSITINQKCKRISSLSSIKVHSLIKPSGNSKQTNGINFGHFKESTCKPHSRYTCNHRWMTAFNLHNFKSWHSSKYIEIPCNHSNYVNQLLAKSKLLDK